MSYFIALAHLRKNETYQQVGAGAGLSEAIAWHYVDETLKYPRIALQPKPERRQITKATLTLESYR